MSADKRAEAKRAVEAAREAVAAWAEQVRQASEPLSGTGGECPLAAMYPDYFAALRDAAEAIDTAAPSAGAKTPTKREDRG